MMGWYEMVIYDVYVCMWYVIDSLMVATAKVGDQARSSFLTSVQ